MSKQNSERLFHRHKIENLFCRLDKFRRLHLRVDNYIQNYEAFNHLAMSLITCKFL